MNRIGVMPLPGIPCKLSAAAFVTSIYIFGKKTLIVTNYRSEIGSRSEEVYHFAPRYFSPASIIPQQMNKLSLPLVSKL